MYSVLNNNNNNNDNNNNNNFITFQIWFFKVITSFS